MEEGHPAKQIMMIALSFLVGMALEVIPLPHWACVGETGMGVYYFNFLGGVTTAIRWHCRRVFCRYPYGFINGKRYWGQHALAFTFIVYLIIAFHPQLKTLSVVATIRDHLLC